MFDTCINISVNRSAIAFSPCSIFARQRATANMSVLPPQPRLPIYFWINLVKEILCWLSENHVAKFIKEAKYWWLSYPVWHTFLIWFCCVLLCSVVCRTAITGVITSILFDKSTDRCLISPWGLGANQVVWHLNKHINKSISHCPRSSFQIPIMRQLRRRSHSRHQRLTVARRCVHRAVHFFCLPGACALTARRLFHFLFLRQYNMDEHAANQPEVNRVFGAKRYHWATSTEI